MFTFNMSIDNSSIPTNTFKLLKDNSDEAILGKIEAINNTSIVFVPNTLLDPNTKYIDKIYKENKN